MDKIIFFDFCSLYNSSFYLEGFYNNQEQYNYRFSISRHVPDKLLNAYSQSEWQSLLHSICLFMHIGDNGQETYFCIDANDGNMLDLDNRRLGYHFPILEQVDLYFKVNINGHIIDEEPLLKQYSSKILPVNQFFPLKTKYQLSFLRGLLTDSRHCWTRRDVRQRFRELRRFPDLEYIIKLRSRPRNLDIFFVTSFRHNPIHREEMDHRLEIMTLLGQHKNLSCHVGFTSLKKIPGKYGEFQLDRLLYRDYLENLASAEVVIYTRGVDECISSKFALYLALGKMISGQKFINNTNDIYKHELVNQQCAFDSPADIVSNALGMLSRKDVKRDYGKLNADLFDKYFSPTPTIVHVLSCLGITTVDAVLLPE